MRGPGSEGAIFVNGLKNGYFHATNSYVSNVSHK